MKAFILTLALAISAGAYADEWVSVGAARAVAPAAQSTLTDSSSRATFAAPVRSGGADSSALVEELAIQMEQMQQELAVLRGRVEEQDHLIKRMNDEQQQRYLDVDRRLSVLINSPSPSSSVTSSPAALSASYPASSNSADVYQQAMVLVREKKFQEASAAFDSFIQTYPQDPLAGNAYYWSGEVWLVLGDLDKALQQFKKVVASYSGHDKEADATYKIGVTLHRQGKTADARVWLQRVIDRFTGKADGTVRLARSYLDKL